MAFTPVPTVTDGDDVVDDFGNDVSAAVTELQKLTSSGESGPDDGTATSGTTPKTIDTITVPDKGPGTIHVWANAIVSKTVATDRFGFVIQVGGVPVNTVSEPSPQNSSIHAFSATGSRAVAGGSSTVIDVILTRSSGSGTASAAVGSQVSLHYIFVPAP